ncbi:FUSC family protein [uncultured Friedmanniella sp.]|uniref:FUSC family protein n=1 Tax=uncultured Friedmanniella sp. TaxID=335381 RepID=UPI0035CA8120
MSGQAAAPTAPAPHTPRPRGVRAMLGVRSTSRQWPVALRTAVSVAGPVLVGVLAGNLAAGLLAGIGGFASLYGSGRPYPNRARLLLAVAFAQAVVVTLGAAASGSAWVGIAVVTVIAVLATWVCNAFGIQPGSYQIALTCASGTALHEQGFAPLESGLLVLSGGLLATAVQLTGALVDLHGPERAAVADAAESVAHFVEGANAEDADDRQHAAATALHRAWIVLVNQQPHRRHTPSGLARLRETTRTLQLIVAGAQRSRRPDREAAARARRLGAAARRRGGAGETTVLHALPLGRPDAAALLLNTVAPGSRSLLVLVRVAVATLLAGSIGTTVGLTHAYWAIAAAVLVLSQGADQRSTVQRGLERTAGTFLGLVVVALLLGLGLTGVPLVAALAVILYVAQLLVPRNYVLAAALITCSAMLMAVAGRPAADTAVLLQARGLDTALGCVVAIVVFTAVAKRSPTGWLPQALSDTLYAAATACEQLTPATVTSWTGLTARRDLQRAVIRLGEAYENGVNGFARQRSESERAWPVVVAVERLAYRVLAESWRLEEAAARTPVRHGPEPAAPPAESLRVLGDAARQGRSPGRLDAVPGFLSRDAGDLRRLLAR